MLVNLYTRQHENSYYELKNEGRMTNKEIYVRLHMMDLSDYFTKKYRKFVELAEDIVPRPEGIEYPIWCSLTKGACMKAGDKDLVYCLQVPEEEIIYFSSVKWDYVLNNMYIPLDKDDESAYLKKIDEMGLTDQYHFLYGKYAGKYPHIEKKIIDSWDRIFDIEIWDEFRVQANLWQIKKEWVKHIVRPGENIFEIASDMEDDLELHKKAYYKE